jgi:hypothetical protein
VIYRSRRNRKAIRINTKYKSYIRRRSADGARAKGGQQMADSELPGTRITLQDATDPSPKILTADDIQALADRLLSRGVSSLMQDQPELQRDFRLAAAALTALVHDWPTGRCSVAVIVFD